MDNSVGQLIEKAKKYDEAKAKHNARCYKYYEANRDALRAKRNSYAKQYYENRKKNMPLEPINEKNITVL
jgi:hypothetical protein